MQTIVLEKDGHSIRIVTAVHKIHTFLCTNGLKTCIIAECRVVEKCRCNTLGKDN